MSTLFVDCRSHDGIDFWKNTWCIFQAHWHVTRGSCRGKKFDVVCGVGHGEIEIIRVVLEGVSKPILRRKFINSLQYYAEPGKLLRRQKLSSRSILHVGRESKMVFIHEHLYSMLANSAVY